MGQSRNRGRKAAGASKPVPKLNVGSADGSTNSKFIDGSATPEAGLKQNKIKLDAKSQNTHGTLPEPLCKAPLSSVSPSDNSPLINSTVDNESQASAPQTIASKGPPIPVLLFPSAPIANHETTPRNFAPKPTLTVSNGNLTARRTLESQQTVTSPILTPRGSYKDMLITPRGSIVHQTPLSARQTPRCRDTQPNTSRGRTPSGCLPSKSAEKGPQASQGLVGKPVVPQLAQQASRDLVLVVEDRPAQQQQPSAALEAQRREVHVATECVARLEDSVRSQQEELQECIAAVQMLGSKRESLAQQAAALQSATAHARRVADTKRAEIEDLEVLVHGLSATLESVKLQEVSSTPHLASGKLTLLKVMHNAARALKAPSLLEAVDNELAGGSSARTGGLLGGSGVPPLGICGSTSRITSRSDVTTSRFFTPGTSVKGADSPPAQSVYSLHSTRSVESDSASDASSSSDDDGEEDIDAECEPTPTPPGFTPPVQRSPTSTEKSRSGRRSRRPNGTNNNPADTLDRTPSTLSVSSVEAPTSTTSTGVEEGRRVMKRGIALPPLNLPKLGQTTISNTGNNTSSNGGASGSAAAGGVSASSASTPPGSESNRPSVGAMARLASIRSKINAAEILLSARVDSSP